jgi:central glycolytic genes regulator
MGEHKYIEQDKLATILKYAFPETEELLPLRFNLLNTIKFNQPVGRRMLSNSMGLTERVVRRESDILKDTGLIDYHSDGMRITDRGIQILELLQDIFYKMSGIDDFEKKLAASMGIRKVIIGASGGSDDYQTLTELGLEAAKYFSSILKPKSIIGLTGGSSIERVVNGYKSDWVHFNHQDIKVVPARGGLGNKSEYQANTLAERLANKLDASYELLYTQDNLSKNTIEELKNEPSIKRILKTIDQIDILLFGIGIASVMADRRFLEQEEIDYILGKGAVAESFGYYFNQDGEIVHEISTIGIDLNKFKALKNVIAVAAGEDKAKAIISISKLNPNLVLVTDEATAKKIQSYLI